MANGAMTRDNRSAAGITVSNRRPAPRLSAHGASWILRLASVAPNYPAAAGSAFLLRLQCRNQSHPRRTGLCLLCSYRVIQSIEGFRFSARIYFLPHQSPCCCLGDAFGSSLAPSADF
ncbi:hypothetical protein IWW45_001166 [Coemansia sp. RSA 485]|nr:hypothetical protein IWW45_001166 [Coemansia sp. RSA 485]